MRQDHGWKLQEKFPPDGTKEMVWVAYAAAPIDPPPRLLTANVEEVRGIGNEGAGNQKVMKPNGPRFGITAKKCREGIHIETVDPGAAAMRCTDVVSGEQLRMEPGDHILSVNGTEPETLEQFLGLVASSDQQMSFVVKDQRNGKLRKMTTTLAW